MILQQQVSVLMDSQLRDWPLAARNYGALARVEVKTIDIGAFNVRVQFNPERILSSAAKVDAQSLSQRPCFLCSANLPVEQKSVLWGDGYRILVNPFPIFPRHLTIPSIDHTPQRIDGRIDDMLGLAKELVDFTLFYNGPLCGASAPDHFHFQAGQKGVMPIERYFYDESTTVRVNTGNGCDIYVWPYFPWGVVSFAGVDKASVTNMFTVYYDALKIQSANLDEPMLNILAMFQNDRYILHVFPRTKHRPSHYFNETDNVVMSPASVDMGGLWVTARKSDFDRMDAQLIRDIAAEVCVSPPSLMFHLDELFK